MSSREFIAFAVILLSVLAVDACVMAPDSVRPELEHMSHLTQHEPFTDRPTKYGSDLVNVVAHWDTPAHTYFEIAEGISIDRRDRWTQSYGELVGPREEFSAHIGYVFIIPK